MAYNYGLTALGERFEANMFDERSFRDHGGLWWLALALFAIWFAYKMLRKEQERLRRAKAVDAMLS